LYAGLLELLVAADHGLEDLARVEGVGIAEILIF
jgi:hypothetical protein